MRKCISLLTAEDMKPSYSLAKLALEAEIRGIRRFKCKTINDNGWCLGSECNLYPKRGFGGSSEPLTKGVSTPLIATNQEKSANMRGVAKLGLENPALSDETRAYWFKALFGFKVRKIDEYDNEVHKT